MHLLPIMEKRCVPALIFILVLLASSSTEATIYKLFYRCSNPGVPKNGLRRGDHFGVGYSVEYGCHSNFTMIGTKRATCMFMKYSIGWSSEPPSCIIAISNSTCGIPPRPTRNTVLESFTTTAVVYRCRSDDFIRTRGDRILTCSSNGNWTGSLLMCRGKATCPLPDIIINGGRQFSGKKEGDNVVFYCQPNYDLVGERRANCTATGMWSHLPPKCIRVCPDPGVPANSRKLNQDGTRLGSVVNYECNRGFKSTSGSLRRQCLATGEWSPPAPICKRVDCGPPRLRNGKVTFNSTLFEANATYSCNTGYKLVGERVIQCLSNGVWSYTSRCDAIQCPLPKPIQNGYVQQNSLDFGSEARYSCNSGYVLIGPRNLTCTLNMTWVPEVPVCKIVDCGGLQPPRNGSVSVPYTRDNSIAEYECNDGFTLVGEKTRVCQKNSTWSGQPPLCVVMLSNCSNLRSPEKGNLEVNSTQVGSVAVYSCILGYRLSTESNMRQCLSTGNWSGDEPSCIKVQCPPLISQPNGEVVVDQGTTARYSCNAGYVLVGQANRTCLQTGMWSGNPPVCTPVDCGDLTDPENGAVSVVNTTLGSMANYTCNRGFDISGDVTRVCQQEGEWSGSIPKCISSMVNVPNCGALLPPINGSVFFENTTIGSMANYSCEQGFELIGVSSRTCQGDSTWSDLPPMCAAVVVDCGPPPTPENGQVEFNRTLNGAESNYSCNRGFILEGVSIRTCLSSGNWSGDIPMCIIVDCGLLRSISNGALRYIRSTNFRSEVEYTCNIGYELGSGDRIRTCLDDGNWNGTEPICRGIDCGTLQSPKDGNVQLDSTLFGSIATYSCNSGFRLVGEANRTCTQNGTWSNRPSSCAAAAPAGRTIAPSFSIISSAIFSSTSTFSSSSILATLIPAPSSTQISSSTPDVSILIPTSTRTTPAAILPSVLAPSSTDIASFMPSASSSFILASSSTRTIPTAGSPAPRSTRTIPTAGSPAPSSTRTIPTAGSPAPSSTDIASFIPGASSSFILTSSSARTTPSPISSSSSASSSLSPTPIPTLIPTIPPITCDDLPNPDNGIVTINNRSVGSMVRYSCNSGFTLRGERTRECNANGMWTGEAPICFDNDSIDCGRPIVPTNGELTISTTTFGSMVRYSCRLPYRLVGNIVRTCQIDATWSGTVPQCILINCGDPEIPTNGIVDFTRTTFEAIANYRCVNGYNRIGTERRVCGRLGLWSGRVPRCQIADCGSPGDFPNGIVIVPRTTFNGVATFFCDSDFRRVGDRRRVCQADGTWTGSVPTCIDERPDCGDPGTPNNGRRTLRAGTRRGDTVEYTCSNGFVLMGNTERECQQNGIWSGALPTCNKITSCPVLGVPANARRINGNFSVGMFVYFVCSDDYDLIGSNARECRVNGTWSGTQPECMVRNTDCNTIGVTMDTVGRRCTCEDRQLTNCSRLREDWTTLSTNKKAAYIQAVKAVTSNRLYRPRYRDLMKIFADSADTLAQGRRAQTSLKFPWNRFFLQEYEDLLRMVDSAITIPFWDWTISNTNPYRHPVFDPNDGFGNSSNAVVNCVTSGPFSVDQFTVTPLAGGGCLTREYLQSTFLSRTGLTTVVLAHTAAEFNQFFQRIAFFPYLNVRCSVGGIICGDNGAEDPLYVLSAAFVDKVWDQWQGLSNSRLRARYANDNSSLPLTNLRVQEYHDNSNLPFGASVLYGPLVAIGGRGAGGAADHDRKVIGDHNGGYEDKGELLQYKDSEGLEQQEGRGFVHKDEGGESKDSTYECAMSEAVLERSRLTEEDKELYIAMCLKS